MPLAHFLFPSAGTQSAKSVANPSFTKPSLQIHIEVCPELGSWVETHFLILPFLQRGQVSQLLGSEISGQSSHGLPV